MDAKSTYPVVAKSCIPRSELLSYWKQHNIEQTYNMLVENHNTCLLDVFAGTCSQKNLPIYEHFPSVQGPAEEGYMLDFLGLLAAFVISGLAAD